MVVAIVVETVDVFRTDVEVFVTVATSVVVTEVDVEVNSVGETVDVSVVFGARY